jgi:hypothetical protein
MTRPSAKLGATLLAGVAYFAVVFTIGFILGTVRTLLIAPRLGETGAVGLEAPFMLAASWAASLWAVYRFRVPPAPGLRLLMGACALALLAMAEMSVSVGLFGRTFSSLFETSLSPADGIGLASQLAFGLIPLLQVTLQAVPKAAR